ncbi:hypothetical protein C0584_00490 [Candidatus Parcubacteria bacterium]|nr:MAG: hypothetical protein C0584_00490 [Candidatus Parcubacteria bacterium]
MNKILNKIAWLVSLSFGLVLVILLGVMTDLLDGSGAFDDDSFFVWLIFIGLFGAMTKGIFLSRKSIESLVGEKEESTIMQVKELKGTQQEKIDDLEVEFDEKLGPKASESEKKPQSIPLGSQGIMGTSILDNQDSALSKDESLNVFEDVAEKKEVSPKKEEPGIFQQFFAENALAKIGGILLFLGVLFLLKLVYTVIGPIGKLMIGFMIGIILFSIGALLDSKGYRKEARIVIGTSILINYLVILSGRYLIEESSHMGKTILSEGLTFFFLILNTLFAISTSIAYRSNALLFFSFVVSFLNPFLIGASSDTPYTLAGYALIVSLGAFIITHILSEKDQIGISGLHHIGFLGGGILILLAPFTLNSEWLVKLAALGLLSFGAIFLLYRRRVYEEISSYFIGAYVFFFFLLQYGGVVLPSLSGSAIFVSYSAFSLVLLALSVYLFLKIGSKSLFYVFFAPLLIFLSLLFTSQISTDHIILLMCISVVSYVATYAIIARSAVTTMTYTLFGILGFFIVSVNVFLGNISKSLSFSEVEFSHMIGIIISTYIFYFATYFFSTKKGLESLYSLGTLLGIFMVLPVISRSDDFRVISMIGISGLIVLNIILPLINKRLLYSNIQNLVFGVTPGAIFAVSQIYYFMFGDRALSQMSIGLSYLALAIVYFSISYFVYTVILRANRENENKISTNVFYTFVGISISIFSLAIAFIFSTRPEVVSIVWLFEASVLFYFYNKTSNSKIYFSAIILMAIGLAKTASFIFIIRTGAYINLIPLAIIFTSVVLSLKFLEKEERNIRIFHDVAHFIGMTLSVFMLMEIMPKNNGYEILSLALFSLLLFSVYAHVFAGRAKYFLILFLSILMGSQIISLDRNFWIAERDGALSAKLFQYLSTIILVFGVLMFNQIKTYVRDRIKVDSEFFKAVNIIAALYTFIISTQYVYYLVSENIFAVSIYWGIISFVLLARGINEDMIKYRTVGLYVMTLAVSKIVFFDIWNGVADAVMRVIALMVVGGVMITVSTLYSKKYGDQLKGEFSLENLLNEESRREEGIGKILSEKED